MLTLYSVIVHYNTPHEVVKLVQELLDCSNANHFILVVDNHSEKSSLDYLKTNLQGIGRVHLIIEKKNGGFGYGVNRAIAYIKQQETEALVHVINSDATIINKNYLNDLSNFLNLHPAVAMVGPKVLEQDGVTVQNTILPLTSIGGIFSFKKKYSAFNRSALFTEPVQVECLNGVCFMIRLSAFLTIGGFDEQYFMYNEEQDLCYKIGKAGGQIYFIPVTSILHSGADHQAVEKTDWRFLYKRRNIVLFLRKNRSRAASVLIAFIFSISSIPKFLQQPGGVTWKKFVKELWSVA